MMAMEDDGLRIVEGTLLSMHLVASADGLLADEELDYIADMASVLTAQTVGRERVLDISNGVDRKLAEVGPAFWQGSFRAFRELSAEARKLMLRGAIMVAIADADYHADERAMLADLAGWLGLSDEEFGAVLKEVQDELRTA